MIAVWMLTWKELIRKKVTLMTLLLTVLFWIAFYFIARSAGASVSHYESGIISLDNLIDRFRGSAILLWIRFFLCLLCDRISGHIQLRGSHYRGSGAWCAAIGIRKAN